MSLLNPIVGSIAGATLQAQDNTRAKERLRARATDQFAQVRGLEEEEDHAGTRLHIDGQVPDHGGQDTPERQARRRAPDHLDVTAAETEGSIRPAAPPTTTTVDPSRLYTHIDLKI